MRVILNWVDVIAKVHFLFFWLEEPRLVEIYFGVQLETTRRDFDRVFNYKGVSEESELGFPVIVTCSFSVVL